MPTESRDLGQGVRSLQTMLRTVAKAGAPVPHLIPDGIFGPETDSAVRAFQRHVKLPASGRVDLATHEALVLEFDRAGRAIGPAAALEILLQPHQRVVHLEKNDHLFLVQAMLLALSGRFGGVPPVAATGTLDRETQAALRWLQALGGLPEHGEFDRETWRLLTRLYRSGVQDGSHA